MVAMFPLAASEEWRVGLSEPGWESLGDLGMEPGEDRGLGGIFPKGTHLCIIL